MNDPFGGITESTTGRTTGQPGRRWCVR